MKYRAMLVVLLNLIVFIIFAYCSLAVYFFLNKTEDGVVEDHYLITSVTDISDEENKYTAFLAMTNVIHTSDVGAVLCELHKVAKLPYYQGPTNTILPFMSINGIARHIDEAIKDLRKKGRYQEAVSAIRDFYSFTKDCRDYSSSAVELLLGVGLCNMVYMEVATLSLDVNVPNEIFRELDYIVCEEPDFTILVDRTLRCEYSFWTRPRLSQLRCTVDKSELKANVEDVVGFGKRSIFSRIIANMLVNIPGYVRFSFNQSALLQYVAAVYQRSQFEADSRDAGVFRTGILEPNWYGIRVMSKVCSSVVSSIRLHIKRSVLTARFARVIVALRLYERKYGKIPASLDALVPEFLSSVPMDPFNDGHYIMYDCEKKMIGTTGGDAGYVAIPSVGSTQCIRVVWAKE